MMRRKRLGKFSYIFIRLFILAIIFGVGNWSGIKLYNVALNKGCIQIPQNIVPVSLKEGQPIIRFIAIGDAGLGNEEQKRMAVAISKICRKQGCDFILYLGDNFYPQGVNSLEDPLFKQRFEDIYNEVEVPFFSILGNHDTQGNIQAQILYSLKNQKWKMPNYNYNFQAGPANFSAINTNCSLFGIMKLSEYLDEKDSTWNFVFGHHTLYSSGIHGDADLFTRILWTNLFEGRVDFYIAGHDHELEHLTIKGHRSQYVVSGAGGKNYRSERDSLKTKTSIADSKFVYQDNGLVWFQVTAEQASVKYFDAQQNMIYQFTKHKE